MGGRTEDCVLLAILVATVRADERAKVIVLDFLLVLLDEVAPALLAIGALHPVFVELDEPLVWFCYELGKLLGEVREDLVVDPKGSGGVSGW